MHYLDPNSLLPTFQSGFRKFHSTETLLVRLLSDFYGAIDISEATLLALFDISVAFDTVDHDIILQRLLISYGLYGSALDWLTSLLQDRSLMGPIDPPGHCGSLLQLDCPGAPFLVPSYI